MDTLCSLENYLFDVKEDEILVDIAIVDNTCDDFDVCGEIGDEELAFLVEEECIFIFTKDQLKAIRNLLDLYDVHNDLFIYVNNRWN